MKSHRYEIVVKILHMIYNNCGSRTRVSVPSCFSGSTRDTCRTHSFSTCRTFVQISTRSSLYDSFWLKTYEERFHVFTTFFYCYMTDAVAMWRRYWRQRREMIMTSTFALIPIYIHCKYFNLDNIGKSCWTSPYKL